MTTQSTLDFLVVSACTAWPRVFKELEAQSRRAASIMRNGWPCSSNRNRSWAAGPGVFRAPTRESWPGRRTVVRRQPVVRLNETKRTPVAGDALIGDQFILLILLNYSSNVPGKDRNFILY